MAIRTCLTALLLLAAASQGIGGQNVVVVLDDSGSMQETMRGSDGVRKIVAAKQALLTVLERLPEDAQVGVVALNSVDDWVIPLGPLDQSGLAAAVQRIRANGSTPLGAHMKVAADGLLQLRERERYGTYKLLVVTDGEASDQHLVEGYLGDVLARGITVDVIGVDMREDHSLATQVNTYRRANDPDSLSRAISEVVLGESTADGGDAGESDFELLAALPDDIAVAALSAMTSLDNEPIGGSEAVASIPLPNRSPGATVTPGIPGQGSGGGGGLVGFLSGACGFGCFSVLVILMLVFSMFSKKKR